MKQKIRKKFWNKIPLDKMNEEEWEALCDGCGKCCQIKLQDETTNNIYYTRISCKLFNSRNCKCISYQNRFNLVPSCMSLNIKNLQSSATWLPKSCTYRLIYEGKPIPSWHPLISNDEKSVHTTGNSIKDKTISENDVLEEFWEDFIVEGSI